MTSEGGEVLTLAGDGAGVVTSKFGHVFTIATAAVASGVKDTPNSSPAIFSVSTPLLVGLVSVILSTVLGFAITL